MKLIPIKNPSDHLIQELTQLWELSVRATHDFLSEEEILAIKPYLPEGLGHVPILVVAEEMGQSQAFMGIDQGRLEMLFVHPQARGKGIGKALLIYGMENFGVTELTVNEQNPQAVGFYQHMGFETYKRTELDEEGRPYPLLYMKRN